MSVSLMAKTRIADTNTQKIIEYCNSYSNKHNWADEKMSFFISENEILGDFKLPKSESKFNRDVKFAIEILKQSGQKFKLDWDVFIGEFIGKISNGIPDDAISKMISEIESIENKPKEKPRVKWMPIKGVKPRAKGKKQFQP